MPRWRALPEELDPEIREFANQMRRLVDRSGLSIAAVSDRTGYSKTSWERYLNGRLLPPQGAISALAEVTGTDVRHLATMWELAERAWSRAEMRHDLTMEAIRISQARQALGDNEPDAPAAKRKSKGRDKAAKGSVQDAVPVPPPGAPTPGADDVDKTTMLRRQPPAPEPTGAPGPQRYHAPEPPGPVVPSAAAASSGGGGRPSGGRRIGMFLAGVVGALAVIAAALFVFDMRGESQAATEPSPTPTKVDKKLPAGVKCSGEDCTGEDPELMGCGGQYAETTSDAVVGNAYIEVRYSEVCAASWARVTDAAPGVTLRIASAKNAEKSEVGQNTDAYTKMVAAKSAEAAKACLETAGGTEECTGS
jgi:transcriptional regulator with XRE-family HTH domain